MTNRIENIGLYKNLYTDVHSSINRNSQKAETTQMSINNWINTLWHIHKMEHYSSIKRNEVLIHDTMNNKNMMLS